MRFRSPFSSRRQLARPRALLLLEWLEARDLLAVNVPYAFDGLKHSETSLGTTVFAPDPGIAASGDHIVQTVNSDIVIFRKSDPTRLPLVQPLCRFFGFFDNCHLPPPLGTGIVMADPYVVYDDLEDRFFVGAVRRFDNPLGFTQSWYHLAVSNTSDPERGFTDRHQVETTQYECPGRVGPCWAHYPRLGYNNEAYVVRLFTDYLGNVPVSSALLSIDKDSVTDINVNTFTWYLKFGAPDGRRIATAPAVMYNAPPDRQGFIWLVSEKREHGDPNPANQLRLIKVTNVLSTTPVLTPYDIPVASYLQPLWPPSGAPHKIDLGCEGNRILLFDSGIINSDWRYCGPTDERMVVAHHVGTGGANNRAVVRWYEFNTANTPPTLTQSGEINPTDGDHVYWPGIAIAPNGDLGMTFMRSSATEYISMQVTGRKPGDQQGMMQNPITSHQGTACFDHNTGSHFGTVAIDPNPLPGGGPFWATNQYGPLENDPQLRYWRTGIANFSITGSGGAPSALDVFATEALVDRTDLLGVKGQERYQETVADSATAGTLERSAHERARPVPPDESWMLAVNEQERQPIELFVERDELLAELQVPLN